MRRALGILATLLVAGGLWVFLGGAGNGSTANQY